MEESELGDHHFKPLHEGLKFEFDDIGPGVLKFDFDDIDPSVLQSHTEELTFKMSSGWFLRLGVVLLGMYAPAMVVMTQECRVPDTCPALDGRGEDLDDVDGMFDDDNVPMDQLKKDLAGNEPMKKIFDEMSRGQDTATSVKPQYDYNWASVCPSSHYTPWLWGFWHPKHGICYAFTRFTGTRCTTRYCRFITHWTDSLFYHHRCFQRYCPVWFWAWCPWSHQFIYTYRRMPCCCGCHRYRCRGSVWPASELAKELPEK